MLLQAAWGRVLLLLLYGLYWHHHGSSQCPQRPLPGLRDTHRHLPPPGSSRLQQSGQWVTIRPWLGLLPLLLPPR